MLAFRYKVLIVLVAYFVLLATGMGILNEYTKTKSPLLIFPIHLGIMFIGLALITYLLTGKEVEFATNAKLAVVFLLVFEMMQMYASQMVTKTGELVTEAPLWNMTMDSLFGWFYIEILGLTGELVYWLTYVLTPVICITLIVVICSKSELKELIQEMTS